jgi:hypothetical protein
MSLFGILFVLSFSGTLYGLISWFACLSSLQASTGSASDAELRQLRAEVRRSKFITITCLGCVVVSFGILLIRAFP